MGYTSKLLSKLGQSKFNFSRLLNFAFNLPAYLRASAKMESDRRKAELNVRDKELISQINRDSLLFYWGNIHSQRGQDGILAEIFRRIGVTTGLFVEFGAWDGIFLSNSRWLFEMGWKGVWIEADDIRYDMLTSIYGEQTVNIRAMVGAPSFCLQGERLCDLLDSHLVNLDEVTFLSIDVDGPDLEIFEDSGLTPPVVLIEGGFNFIPTISERFQPEISLRFQQPLQVILDTADRLGYDAVCFCQDTYLVRKDLSAPFVKFDAMSLYKDAYYFIPNDFRASLLETRDNPIIVEAETRIFGVNRTRSPI